MIEIHILSISERRVVLLNIGIKEVKVYLEDVKKLVKAKKYVISDRDKNRDLFDKYYVDDEIIEEVIFGLTYKDFSYADNNEHPKYKNEKLYIFGKDVLLLSNFTNDEELVSLYIKFNKLDNYYIIVVSFHEQEYPLIYKFK